MTFTVILAKITECIGAAALWFTEFFAHGSMAGAMMFIGTMIMICVVARLLLVPLLGGFFGKVASDTIKANQPKARFRSFDDHDVD